MTSFTVLTDEQIAALEADAARYRFLKTQNWHIENKAIDDAMKGGA